MARFAHAGKGAISTARGRDDCGKSFFQHLSCGVTIRQNPVGAYRNVINGSIAACRKVNGSLHIHSDWRLVTCRTKGRRNHRTASICSGLSQCSDVRAWPEYRAFRLRGLTPTVPVMQSTQACHRQHLRIPTGPWLHDAPVRCVLLQRVVKAIIMVIPYVLA